MLLKILQFPLSPPIPPISHVGKKYIYVYRGIFYWLCYYSCPISPPFPPLPGAPFLQQPPFSLCPWALHISSLVSPFTILLLTFPCPFCTYQLCFLIPAPFLLFFSSPLPADNPPSDLHIYDSVTVLFVRSVFCCCCFFFFILIKK